MMISEDAYLDWRQAQPGDPTVRNTSIAVSDQAQTGLRAFREAEAARLGRPVTVNEAVQRLLFIAYLEELVP